MWKVVDGPKVLFEYFSKFALNTSGVYKEEYKSTEGKDCFPKKWHGCCHNHHINDYAIPENIHTVIKKIIKDNNKEEYEFKYEVSILKYTFDTNEYIYNLNFHDDNNYQTIIMYLDRYNVTDLFYIATKNGDVELVNLDVSMWQNKGMLILGENKTLKNMPKHGGLFMKQNKNKSAYRKILSIFISDT